MFDDASVQFPNNAVLAISTGIDALNTVSDPEKIVVVRRPLRTTDPKLTAGVFASSWAPNEDSYEIGQGMGGGYRHEPTLQQYIITIQTLVMDMDEMRGLAKSSAFAKTVRDVLLRDPSVGVALSSLRATGVNNLTESARRRWVRTQRYLSNEIQGSFVYLSTLEITIETETS